jgi:predicted RNA-binding protein
MAYFTNLFSPETYETYSSSEMTITGFREKQLTSAQAIQPGDRFVCYMTKLSRWIGVLEVISNPYRDETPFYYQENDPFIIRFKVKPIVWLTKEKAIPIQDDRLWKKLSFTKGIAKNSSQWTGVVRGSLRKLSDNDGKSIEDILMQLQNGDEIFPIDPDGYAKLLVHKVRRLDKIITVSVPQAEPEQKPTNETRESHKMQALLATIGVQMGMRIWIPRNDRRAVLAHFDGDKSFLLEQLPLNYDDTTLKTIEQIDVIWLKNRSMARAFEVEHTTSIYSGILRMADLLALQPNMDIRLHLVAPSERRHEVMEQIRRPVFSMLERRPLAETCTYMSYESLKELSQQKHLNRMTDAVLDDYAEEAVDL